MNMASDVRGEGPLKELHTSLLPVGLPVAGTHMCADQEMKSMKNTSNI